MLTAISSAIQFEHVLFSLVEMANPGKLSTCSLLLTEERERGRQFLASFKM
jgi:hypothetical protein